MNTPQHWMLLLGIFLLLVVGVIGGELLAAALTGRVPRTYSSMDQQATITVTGNALSLDALVSTYQPAVYMATQYMPPDVLNIWYQVVDHNDTFTIVYYLDWENEIHPNPILHRLYEFYRMAVYGSSHDIEFIEITVSRESGVVTKVRYETSPEGLYNRELPVHLVALFEQNITIDGYDYLVLDRESGEQIMAETIYELWDDEHPVTLEVFTWNHMYTMARNPADLEHSTLIAAPLHYLTENVYTSYKFARRSQGDIVTPISDVSRNILRLFFWILTIALAVLLWRGR